MRQHQPRFKKIPAQNNHLHFFYVIVLLLLFLSPLHCLNAAAATADPDPLRFQKEIKRFSWQDAKNSYPQQAVLFVGSSSIYAWKTAQAFPTLPVINRGFGGSQLSDLNYYFEVVVKQYRPAKIICYCGENDVAEKKEAAQILADFKIFSSRIKSELPDTVLLFLAIKPNPLRWQMWNGMAETNRVIKNYCQNSGLCIFLDTATPLFDTKGQPDKKLFAEDGLHLNEKAYTILDTIIYPTLDKLWHDKK